jgi:hypothetical protein
MKLFRFDDYAKGHKSANMCFQESDMKTMYLETVTFIVNDASFFATGYDGN